MKRIELTQGQYTIVDDEYFEMLNKHKWCALRHKNTFYAVRAKRIKGTKKMVHFYMHRIIMDIKDPKIMADHKDGNGLNNQKANLRLCNKSQNAVNRMPAKGSSSKYLGVRYNALNRKWQASVCKDRKIYQLGKYDTEEAAAMAYNKKATELHGEFTRLNQIN